MLYKKLRPKMDNNQEALLIQSLREGLPEAYKLLFAQHYEVLCHFASGFVKDDFLAETIVSDVIFHIWEVREAIVIETSIRKYLLKSVRNRCINYLNSSYYKNEGETASRDISNLSVVKYLKNDDYPLGRLLEKELETVIEEAINNLPEQCRRIFCMSRFDGMKYQEIADEMSISVNTVKFYMKKALTQLREDLNKYIITLFIIYMGGS